MLVGLSLYHRVRLRLGVSPHKLNFSRRWEAHSLVPQLWIRALLIA